MRDSSGTNKLVKPTNGVVANSHTITDASSTGEALEATKTRGWWLGNGDEADFDALYLYLLAFLVSDLDSNVGIFGGKLIILENLS